MQRGMGGDLPRSAIGRRERVMEIRAKAAVVVGGASGMAKATAEMLVREGAQVSILDLPTSEGAAVAKELGGSFHACDVTDFDGTEAALERAVATKDEARRAAEEDRARNLDTLGDDANDTATKVELIQRRATRAPG